MTVGPDTAGSPLQESGHGAAATDDGATFEVDPWMVRESSLHLGALALTE